jgi:hypothetical protein
MKRVSELTGAELDYAVAICEGWVPPGDPFVNEWIDDKQNRYPSGDWRSLAGRTWLTARSLDAQWYAAPFGFSRDWKLGGPLIERERIKLSIDVMGTWMAGIGDKWNSGAETPLIAAMRAFVASRLGDEIEIPERTNDT